MIKLGLTGSIGMGKSTVAGMFRDLGARIWNADKAVHALYEKGGAAVEPIRQLFPCVIKDGKVERDRLAALVLEDDTVIRQIEAIVHPLVWRGQADFITGCEAEGSRLAVFDIPLLFEHDRQSRFDAVALVLAREDIRRARVLARPGMSPDRYEKIKALQMPDAEKARHATYVIRTDCTMAETRQTVSDVHEDLLEQVRGLPSNPEG